MPELPEIETIKLGLTPRIKNAVLGEIIVRQPKLRTVVPHDLPSKVKGSKVIALRRRGKYLLLDLAPSLPPAVTKTAVYTAVIHLGMSGSFTIHSDENGGKPLYTKHDHIIFQFTDSQGDSGELRYNDPRRFGLVDIVPTNELEQYKYLKNLGIEPLTKEFNGAWLHKALAGKSVAIKQALMNANLVVGVGNIYANEALFSAQIHPQKPAGKVSLQDCKKLCKIIKQTLEEAIAAGGSSLRDHRQADGTLGYFQHNFKVYGKAGQPCGACGMPIEKIVQGGRATYFCGKCQLFRNQKSEVRSQNL